MIRFALSDEQQLLQGTARSFAQSRLRPCLRAHERGGLCESCLGKFEALGFTQLQLPVGEGGSEAGALERVVLFEELAAGDGASALVLSSGSWLSPLWASVPEPGRQRLCDRARRGPLRVGLFWDRWQCLRAESGAWHGVIPLVPTAPVEWLLVRQGDVVALFAADGLAQERVRSGAFEAGGASEVRLEGSVPLLQVGDTETAERTSAFLRLHLAALLLGVSHAAHTYALAYARERVVFGKPVAQHQAPAFELADMRIGLEAARGLLWRAAHAWDKSERQAPVYAAMAYLEAAELALWVTRDSVQLLGGHGFLRDHPVEKWMREARALSLLWGGRDAACDDLARWSQGECLGTRESAGATPERREQ